MEEPELEPEHEPEPELSLATSVLPRSIRSRVPSQDWRFISQTLQEQRDAVQAAHEGVP